MSSVAVENVHAVRAYLLIDDSLTDQSPFIIPAFHQLLADMRYWNPRNLQFGTSFFNGEEGAYRGSANAQLPFRPLCDATMKMIQDMDKACRRQCKKGKPTQAIGFIFTNGLDVGSNVSNLKVKNCMQPFVDENPGHIVCGIDQPCPATGKDCSSVFGSIGILPNRILHLEQNADGIARGMEMIKLIMGHALDSPSFIPELQAKGIGPWIQDV